MENEAILQTDAGKQKKPQKHGKFSIMKMFMLMAVVSMMAVPAFAEEATAASLLTNAGTVVTSGIGIAWGIITANPILSTIAGVSLIGVAFRVLGRAKHAAHF